MTLSLSVCSFLYCTESMFYIIIIIIIIIFNFLFLLVSVFYRLNVKFKCDI